MLFIDAETVRRILPMSELIPTLERTFSEVLTHDAVHRGRIDMIVPNGRPNEYYRWGTMEGASKTLGMHAIRMKSDVMSYPKDANGDWTTEEKYCIEPGTYCGLVWLFSTRNGEPLAILNEGHLQHMRVAGSGGIGVKYLSRENSETIGVYGSGGMARDFLRAAVCVRSIRHVKVYSPTKEHREAYAADLGRELEIEIEVCEEPREVARGVDIVATCTDSMKPFLQGDWLEPGQHVTTLGGNNWFDTVLQRGDMLFSQDLPNIQPKDGGGTQRFEVGRSNSPGAYVAGNEEDIALLPPLRERKREAKDGRQWNWLHLLNGAHPGRTSDSQVTLFRAGGIKGLDLLSGAYLVYNKAKEVGAGRSIPTEWFLQDVRD